MVLSCSLFILSSDHLLFLVSPEPFFSSSNMRLLPSSVLSDDPAEQLRILMASSAATATSAPRRESSLVVSASRGGGSVGGPFDTAELTMEPGEVDPVPSFCDVFATSIAVVDEGTD